MTQNPETISLKVKAIANRNPHYAEVSRWVGDLLLETVQAADKFRLPDLNLDPKSLPETWYQGKSFLDPGELALDWEQVGAVYKQLVEKIRTREEGRRQLAGLQLALKTDQNGVPGLMKAALTSDFKTIETAALKLKVDPPVLTLFLHLSMRPALLDMAGTVLEHLDLQRWSHGHCPVCGSAPKLADLSGEGGKRTLHCSLCETAWPYQRLRCPFCENDNREDLSYLKAQDEEGLRVDLCSRCKNYIKTIDLRELAGPVIVPLDDVATWHLDLIAQQELREGKTVMSQT